ncbi:MAG: archaeosine synthase subunit alpha [Methanomicrobiales archaeon]|nr:archaeosine synthase subunit alpha [Methanomicrobiales archaeon]
MPRIDIRQRDGLARAGTAEVNGKRFPFPAIADMERLFPALAGLSSTNVPLAADAEFVASFHSPMGPPCVAIHPLACGHATHGDCVVVANWHTALPRPADFVRWLTAMKAVVPPDTLWYAPAAGLPSTAHLLAYAGFDLFDTVAVDLATARGLFCTPEGEVPDTGSGEEICGCRGCSTGDLQLHNRYALERELALVRHRLRAGQLRELVEARCRLHPVQVAILRLLDGEYLFMEPFTPVARSGPLLATTGEALRRPEVRRFEERVVERYLPPRTDVAVLLPCSAKKPYSASRSHQRFRAAIRDRAHELVVTSPLGLVPRDLERVYPAAHYDVPVTGYWDWEELAVISEIIARFLARHPYRRVLAHLDGGALEAARMAAEATGITLEVTASTPPASPDALRDLDAALEGEKAIRTDPVRGTLSWQFGVEVNTRGLQVRGRPPARRVVRGRVPLFSLDDGTGLLRPTFDGWDLIPQGYRVEIDDFLPRGDIMVPGVLEADPRIREGDDVLVMGPRAFATGRAAMGAEEMRRSARGIAVRVRRIMSRDGEPVGHTVHPPAE